MTMTFRNRPFQSLNGRSPSSGRVAISWATVLVAVCLAPLVAAEDLQAARALGAGGLANAAEATVFVAPGAAEFALDVSVGQGTVLLVDEVAEQSVHAPGSDDAVASQSGARHETPLESQEGFVSATESTDGDAVIIVAPLTGGMTVQASTARAFKVEPVEAQVLESSHAVSNMAVSPGGIPFQYYEYSVPDLLRWEADSDTAIIVAGSFEVYLWGIPFTLADAHGARVYPTGYQAEPDASMGGLTSNDHYRYVRILVHGGSLDLTVAGAPVQMFASAIETNPSEVTFQGADGTIPSEGGSFSVDGAVTANEGTYRLAYKPGGMDIDVTQPPLQASGPYVSFTALPWYKQPWFLPTLGGSIALAGFFAVTYVYPTASGTRHLRYMESLTGTPRARGWRSSRAEGYAMMAAAAEDAGHMGRAVLWMTLAAKLDPHDPAKRLDVGVFQAARGRYRAALRHFSSAHKGLLEAGDLENMAHNAYEAARAASLVGDASQALDWLRIAVQADPATAELIGMDPAFAALRETDDYASLTGA